MKMDFPSEDGVHWYRLIPVMVCKEAGLLVDVLMYEYEPPKGFAYKSWTYSVEEGKIFYSHFELFGDMPQEVKDYIDKIFKLKAFW